MTVRIVTDSSADLPSQIVDELGIAVVPLYVRFGETVYRDRIDISEDELVEAERRVLAFLKQKQSELPPMDQRTLGEIHDRIARTTVKEFERVRKDHKKERR